MNRRLVVGLGNRLVEEDAVGVLVAEQLARDARFADVDFICGTTDLLRHGAELRNRDLIVLVDAAAGNGPPGRVLVHEHGAAELSEYQCSAHHLSAVQALQLLRWSDPGIAAARCVWVLVTTTQLPSA
ncbi:MAG TPA: hydrogenase maturation protease [Longimicrobiales bacterium]